MLLLQSYSVRDYCNVYNRFFCEANVSEPKQMPSSLYFFTYLPYEEANNMKTSVDIDSQVHSATWQKE